jgi:hypothetical protein
VGFRDHERLAQPSFTRTGYVEAQIHGGVSASDIAEVVFPADPSPETAAQLRDRGISWRVLRPGDKPIPAADYAKAEHAKTGAPSAPAAKKAAPSKVTDPAAILSSLPADLTPAQKRARLRSRGVPKEQIDALVPLKVTKVVRDPSDIAEEIYRNPKWTESQIVDHLAGLNIAELKKVATATAVQLPHTYAKNPVGKATATPVKLTADQLRKHIAARITRDRTVGGGEGNIAHVRR